MIIPNTWKTKQCSKPPASDLVHTMYPILGNFHTDYIWNHPSKFQKGLPYIARMPRNTCSAVLEGVVLKDIKGLQEVEPFLGSEGLKRPSIF